ncbi:MAG: glycerol kinase GlpK [Anaerolineae bacterium]|nr:glycerol kinase GlpK [Anaerolineae bacterium]
MTGYVLAVDQGTTNTKALLVDPGGAIVGQGAVPTPVHYPRRGWVEQDPLEIWRCSLEAIAQCLADANLPAQDIAAIGIANQRETALLWDRRTGQPVGPAVVWQCRRSGAFCRQLKEAGHEPLLRHRTGLQVDPMFSGSKIRWLLDHADDGSARATAGELCAGNVDAWLLWHFTGGPDAGTPAHATDVTNASRTQLMGLRSLDWDTEVLDIFGIPREVLPVIRPSSTYFGETAAVSLPGGSTLPDGIPIASMIGDSHASLYGLGGFRPGSVKATYGTGTSLMTPTQDVVGSSHGLSSTVAWAFGDPLRHGARSPTRPDRPRHVVYALEGNIYTTGGGVQYVGELLGLQHPASDLEALARTVADAGGVTFVPALVGLGAPYWQDGIKGTISGLTLGTGRPHLARAALEAIAFQVRDVFDVMQADAGASLKTLLADGGASRNDMLMQFQADILGCPVERSRSSEVSPLGAAYLAGLHAGVWQDEGEITALLHRRDRFEPQIGAAQRDKAYARWQQAVRRTLYDT